MKKIVLLALQSACIAVCSCQTIYYYDGSGALSTTSNWWTNRAGTGSSPANFTTNNQHFYIQTGQSVTNSAAWSISGSNTRLLIESSATLTANTSITLSANTTFRIDNGGTYTHNNTNTTAVLGGTESFGATSTFRINNWSTATPVTNNITRSAPGFDGNNYYFGHLELNWAAGATWQQSWATAAIYLTAGNFTATSVFSGAFRFNRTGGAATSPDVYVAGNFIWQSAGTLDFTARNALAYLNVNGHLTQTAGDFTVTGSGGSGSAGYIYTYGNGSSNWTFSGGTRDLIGYRIALQGGATSKTVNLLSNFNMASAASGFILTTLLNVASGCTFDAGTYTLSISAGSTQAATFGTIRTSNINGLTGSTSATFSNSPLVQWGVGTDCLAEYYATGSQTVSAVPIYENVRIMNSGTKTLAGNANIFKTFYFGAGGDYLDAGNDTLTIESSGGISGAGSGSYVITGAGTTAGGGGRLRQNGLSAARIFPVGNSSYYLPVTITPAATGSFAVNAFSTTGMDGIVESSSIKTWPEKTYIADAMWNVGSITGGVAATVNFNWGANALEGTVFTARPDNELGIWRRTTDTIWVPAATGFSPNSNTGNFATAVNIAAGDFNTQFVAAWQTQILPIHFLYFTGTATNNGHQLHWQLDGLAGINRLEVETAETAGFFSPAGSLPPAAGNRYSFLHTRAAAVAYYRVKLVMHNGAVQYSPVIKIMRQPGSLQLLTPVVAHELLLTHDGGMAVTCRIFDAAGRLLLNRNVPAQTIIRLPLSSMQAGVGVVIVNRGSTEHSFRFTKQ